MKGASAAPGTEQMHVDGRMRLLPSLLQERAEKSRRSSESRHGAAGGHGRSERLSPLPAAVPRQRERPQHRVPAASVWVFPDTPFCANTSPLPWREAPSSISSDSHHLAGTRASTAQGQINSAIASVVLQALGLPGRPAAQRLLSLLTAPPEGAKRGHAGPPPGFYPIF